MSIATATTKGNSVATYLQTLLLEYSEYKYLGHSISALILIKATITTTTTNQPASQPNKQETNLYIESK